MHISVFPGEPFDTKAVVVSLNGGAVPGIVNAVIVNKSSAHLDSYQESRILSTNYCVSLDFTVFSSNKQEEIALFVDQPGIYISKIREGSIVVNLKPCPEGFTLSSLQLCD